LSTHQSFDFVGLSLGGRGLLRFLSVAFAAQEVGAGGAVKVDADAAGFQFFFLRGFHWSIGFGCVVLCLNSLLFGY
jgi:hypothetical protein